MDDKVDGGSRRVRTLVGRCWWLNPVVKERVVLVHALTIKSVSTLEWEVLSDGSAALPDSPCVPVER
ncbi:hypothetical protein L195_g005242 [Trifolium pratense]|uniref:Uncharacterized protein n=1 Tax=Trifolium pratense TaxID=57577 RepID=A0A2K3P098_TRIPR|nr:hypothetical protein L195_g005242 [Trifolium pratense]